ncbi:MAG: DegV family protein [Acidimicrobiia bacterium]
MTVAPNRSPDTAPQVPTVALVTDSGSQLPATLQRRMGVGVVPLTVVINGREYLEGSGDLASDDFYRSIADGADVSTAAPSPGQFLEVYRAAARMGASQILSIHTGSNLSGTVGSAAVAARMVSRRTEVIDTGMVSFPVACCVWAAGVVLERGGTLADAAGVARLAVSNVDSVSVVGGCELARRSGRMPEDAGEGLPVVALRSGIVDVVDRVADAGEAVDAMVAYVRARADGRPQRVGVGHAVAGQVADELASRLAAEVDVVEVIRYELGPSVGAHTGPGTAGCVFFPDELVR